MGIFSSCASETYGVLQCPDGDVQVVIGAGDPNPLVGGAGIQTLKQAGIEVDMIGGKEEQAAYDLNKEFMERMRAAGVNK